MARIDEKAAELTEQLRAELGAIELTAMEYTLADAIREGSRVTEHNTSSWGDGASACALTAGLVAAKARGY